MANNFGLFFSIDSEGLVLRLPVNPETLPVSRESDNGEYNILGVGSIMIPRIPRQKVVSISSFFPGRPFPGVLTSGGFQPPEFYINFFERVMRDKLVIVYTPVRYYEDGTPFSGGDDSGFKVLVTRFNTEERGGETGDFYYDLELTEYRDYSPQLQTPQQGQTGDNGAVIVTTEPTRDIPPTQLVVGSVCVCNGRYYVSSYGDDPHGNGNGRRVKVSRIVDLSRAYPYHITTESGGPLGWTTADSLQVVG